MTCFRHLERGFTPWALSLPNMPKPPVRLFVLHESSLSAPPDEFSPTVHCCGHTQVYIRPSGLHLSCFLTSCWHLLLSQRIHCLLCHLPHWCRINSGTAASSLQSRSRSLDVTFAPQALTEMPLTGHWVGQHVACTSPSNDPTAPVWVVSTLE